MFQRILPALRRFRHREDGLVSVEAALSLPLLLIVFAVSYTLFDLFRQEAVNSKATYTIADLISRETTALNDDYIDSIYALSQAMIRSDTEISMRVSVVRWDEDTEAYYVDWSVERGDEMDVWTDDTVSGIADKLPIMPDEERVIVVETWNVVEPVFAVNIGTQNMYNLVFTRPRFASQVAYEGSVISDGPAHDDEVDDAIL